MPSTNHLTLITSDELPDLNARQLTELNRKKTDITDAWPNITPEQGALVLSLVRVNLARTAHLGQLIQTATESVLFLQDQLTPEQQMDRMESVVEMNLEITHELRRMTDSLDKLFKA